MTGVRNWRGVVPEGQHPARHGLGFLLSGSLAFLTDAAILSLLTWLGLHPIVARVFAISIAMVVGWRAHRRLTFGLTTPPRLAEFLRYAAVGWTVAAINYGVFALIILALPSTQPLYALVVSSLVAMVFAYLGMRFAAFRNPGA
jgi:putative flippase GtrA